VEVVAAYFRLNGFGFAAPFACDYAHYHHVCVPLETRLARAVMCLLAETLLWVGATQ
jgi:hypothetical protein